MKKLVILGFILSLTAAQSFAGALSNDMIGAKATMMQSAFTGVADDSSAIFYNPSGLAARDKNGWEVQGDAIVDMSNYKISPKGGKDLTSNETFALPGLFVSTKMDQWACGLGVYTPLGGATVKYKDYAGPGTTYTKSAAFMAITPAIAYQIVPAFSVGLGVSAYYGMIDSKVTSDASPINPVQEFSASGIAGYGANLGLMYKVTDALNLGLEVQTPISMKLDGKTKGIGFDPNTFQFVSREEDTTAKFTTPMTLRIGAGYKITPDFSADFDIWYEPWSSMDKITMSTDAGSTDQKTDYKDFMLFNLGLNYKVIQALSILGGVSYNQGGLKDAGFTPPDGPAAAITVDTDTIGVSVGVDWNVVAGLYLDLGVIYYMGLNKEFSGTGYDITYSQNHFMTNLGAAYRF